MVQNAHRDVSDMELEVLQVLWIAAAAPFARSRIACTQAGRPSLDGAEAAGTAAGKGLRAPRAWRRRPAHTFVATTSRKAIGRRLQDVAEKLCGGSLTPLLTRPGAQPAPQRRGTPRITRPHRQPRSAGQGQKSNRGRGPRSTPCCGPPSAMPCWPGAGRSRGPGRPGVPASRVVHVLWVLVLLKLLTPPLLELRLPWPAPSPPPAPKRLRRQSRCPMCPRQWQPRRRRLSSRRQPLRKGRGLKLCRP